MGGRRPLSVVGALALAGLGALAPARAGAQGDGVGPLSPVRVAAQVVAGAVATPVAFVAGGVLAKRTAQRLGASDEGASRAGYAGAWTAAALATAAAPAAIGARGPGRGSYLAALGGTIVGGAASWGLVRLNDRTNDDEPRPPCRTACRIAAVAVFVLPSVGATLAYDASRGPVR